MQTLQSKAGHKEHKWKTLADDEASDFEKQIGRDLCGFIWVKI